MNIETHEVCEMCGIEKHHNDLLFRPDLGVNPACFDCL